MSFAITVCGHTSAVTSHVQKVEGYGDTSDVLDATKGFLARILPCFQSGDGVRVEASGHVDAYSSHLNIQVNGVKLALDEQDEGPKDESP